MFPRQRYGNNTAADKGFKRKCDSLSPRSKDEKQIKRTRTNIRNLCTRAVKSADDIKAPQSAREKIHLLLNIANCRRVNIRENATAALQITPKSLCIVSVAVDQIVEDYSRCSHFCFTETGRKFFPETGFQKQFMKFSVRLVVFYFAIANWEIWWSSQLHYSMQFQITIHVFSWVAPTIVLSSCVATTLEECWPTLSPVCKTFGASFHLSFGTMSRMSTIMKNPDVLKTGSNQVRILLRMSLRRGNLVSHNLCLTVFIRSRRSISTIFEPICISIFVLNVTIIIILSLLF